ncbi:MAG: hypothetical protein JW786_09320, partial [Desulfobacterales bacterium]|nr:hypothetical protein [Desulfobacterales bacterium]
LSIGAHTITLTATDSHGDTGSNTITVTILNNPPTVGIQNPANNSRFLFGKDTVSFNGNAVDPEDGTLSGSSMVWTSNLDGTIGTGTHFSTNKLSKGTHTITVTATDSHGAQGNDSVTIIVADNTSPTVTIESPINDFIYTYNDENIKLQGSAVDIEDGVLTGESLVWTLSGTELAELQIGTGPGPNFFNFHSYELWDTFTITLTATDSQGAVGSDSVTITIGE